MRNLLCTHPVCWQPFEVVAGASDDQITSMFARSFRLDDDLARPVGMDNLDPAGTRTTGTSRAADHRTGLDFDRSTVDPALDAVATLRRRNLDFVLAEGERLLDLGEERRQVEVDNGIRCRRGDNVVVERR